MLGCCGTTCGQKYRKKECVSQTTTTTTATTTTTNNNQSFCRQILLRLNAISRNNRPRSADQRKKAVEY